MRHALDTLSIVAQDWLLAHVQPAWLAGALWQPCAESSSPHQSGEARRSDWSVWSRWVGTPQCDLGGGRISYLAARSACRPHPAQGLDPNFTWRDEDQLPWRLASELQPASVAINSPFDDQARCSIKHQTSWVGCKVHLTETCDDQLHRIITEVKTTLAPIANGDMTNPIHAALLAKDLLPVDHLVDAG